MESMEARLLGWHYIELPTVSYYTTIARQQAPCIWFFSIGFYLNCQAAMHKYSHNHSRLPLQCYDPSVHVNRRKAVGGRPEWFPLQ